MRIGKNKKKQSLGRQRERHPAADRRQGVSVFSYYAGQSRRPVVPERRGMRSSGGARTRSVPLRRRLLPKIFQQHRFQPRHIPTYVACIALVGAVLYTVSLSGSPRVVVEQKPGVIQRDPSEYEQRVQAAWRASVFNRTKLTIHSQQTRQAILDTYRELSDVRIQLPLVGHRATVVLVPAAPSLQIEARGGTFYVDAEGRALADTSYVTSSSSVPVVQDNGTLAVSPGQVVLPQSQVVYIVQLVTELKAVQVPLQSLTLSNKAVNELDVRITGDPYYLKVQLDGSVDARQVVGTYLAMQKKFTADGTRPGEYLDLRVAGKAFYK